MSILFISKADSPTEWQQALASLDPEIGNASRLPHAIQDPP